MSKPCRHFNQRDLILGDGGCSLGHPISKMIEAKTDAPMIDALKALCCKGNGREILDCPSADFKTDEEIEAEKLEVRRSIENSLTALPKILAIKAQMIADCCAHRITDCPLCGAKNTFSAFVNLRGNKHINARCSHCEKGLLE